MRSVSLIILGIFFALTGTSFAHCEIPCGIYNDSMRIALLEEHAGTIEKSMNTIITLSKESPVNYNQLVRWVDNKESHADKLQEIVYQYFMTQRIKPVGADKKAAYAKYVKEITLLHQILVYSMKCKQTTDAGHVKKLKTLLGQFSKSYFSKK